MGAFTASSVMFVSLVERTLPTVSIKPLPGCRAVAIKQMLTPWLRRLGLLSVYFLRLRCFSRPSPRHIHALPSVTAPIQHPAAVLFSHPSASETERPARSLDMQFEPRGFRLMPWFQFVSKDYIWSSLCSGHSEYTLRSSCDLFIYSLCKNLICLLISRVFFVFCFKNNFFKNNFIFAHSISRTGILRWRPRLHGGASRKSKLVLWSFDESSNYLIDKFYDPARLILENHSPPPSRQDCRYHFRANSDHLYADTL